MLVATADALSPVMNVMLLADSTMARDKGRPTLPTTHPNRRYIITPRIVSTLGV